MKLLVPHALIVDIEMRAKSQRNEAGGLLLGQRKDGAIHVTQLSYPTRWDRATPTLFQRSALGHRMTALRAWKTSNGIVDWVGEWHTHPFGSPTPSFTDQASWRKLVKHSKRPMAFLISGSKAIYVGIQYPAQHHVENLSLVETNAVYQLYAPSP